MHFPVVFCNAELQLLRILIHNPLMALYREYIYLFIYLFYCFSGKNAVRVISLFLDSASLKVCDFTVLTHHVPMHLSFLICPLLHIVCLREQPDKSTGLAISHLSVWGGTVSQKLLGKQKDRQLPKVLLSMPNLDPPLSTRGCTYLVP